MLEYNFYKDAAYPYKKSPLHPDSDRKKGATYKRYYKHIV